MRKRLVVVSILLLIIMMLLSACGVKITYPHVEYRNSGYNFDALNKIILLKDGYVLDDGHPYDILNNEDGYDLVLHFVSE